MPKSFVVSPEADFPLPPHSIRISRRARRVNLRVVPGKGLEVVLPLHADPDCVPEIIIRHRDWIEKTLRRIPAALSGSAVIPDRLLLKGGGEVVEIIRRGAADARRAHAGAAADAGGRAPDDGMVSRGNAPVHRTLVLPELAARESLRCLKEWVREEARALLGTMLAALAEEYGFSYAAMSIRFQKSRWGSCSGRGNISLNAALLFLPERLTRYILLHELCHTREMNHSAAFWKLLFAADPDALAKDKAMRGAWKHVPDWLFL